MCNTKWLRTEYNVTYFHKCTEYHRFFCHFRNKYWTSVFIWCMPSIGNVYNSLRVTMRYKLTKSTWIVLQNQTHVENATRNEQSYFWWNVFYLFYLVTVWTPSKMWEKSERKYRHYQEGKKIFPVFLHLTAKGVEKVGDRYKSNIFAVMGMYALLLPREC